MTVSPVAARRGAATAAVPSGMASLTAASAALLLLCLAWAAVDPRTIGGDGVWLKPAKFALSFVVTFGTLALVEARLSRGVADGWLLRGTTAAMSVAFAFEMAYIVWRAARGEASHFNVGTEFGALMYQLMGLGALVLVLGIGVYGVAALRDTAARMTPGLRWAVAVGLILTVILTLPTAGFLGGNGGHLVGTPPPGGRSWPLLGWSGTVGDLRPAHFLALHAMQAVPLYALWRERGGREITRTEVAGAAAAWALLTVLVFAIAIAGYPLIPLG